MNCYCEHIYMYMWLSLQSLWILNRPLVGLILLHPCSWERKTMNGSVYANYELKQHLFLLPVSFHKCPVELKIITCLANFEHIFKKFSTSAVPICFRKSSSVQTKECYVTLYTWVKASFINCIKFIYKIVHALCHSKLSGHTGIAKVPSLTDVATWAVFLVAFGMWPDM